MAQPPPPPAVQPARTPLRRVSYLIPLVHPSNGTPGLPILQIPPPGLARHPARQAHPRPLILAQPTPRGDDRHVPPLDRQDRQDRSADDRLPRHSLGINAFALDFSTHIQDRHGPQGILYTGAKDGLVAAWELAIPTRPRASDPAAVWAASATPHHPRKPLSSDQLRRPDWIYENRHEIDQEALAQAPVPPTSLRQCIQSHTDWCNDIVLCNQNQTDRTLKAWSPHSPDLALSPITIGSHSDYVKCLAHSREAGWVASGGLDCKIKLWDIHESRHHPTVKFPDDASNSSIYSLATIPSGSLLAAGSPSRVIRLYDPRSSFQLSKLVGHTDNVRAILLSDDGTHLLSASSDATVKLWDVGMQRCLYTFSHHSSPVWALTSRHPRLQVFHSGDRAGWVCKLDLEGCGDPSEGECVVLCKVDSDDDKPNIFSTMGNENVVRIIGMDDTFIWTASGSSSVKRWRDVPTRMQRRRTLACALEVPDLSTTSSTIDSHLPSPLLLSSAPESSQARVDIPLASNPTSRSRLFDRSTSLPTIAPSLATFASQPTHHALDHVPSGASTPSRSSPLSTEERTHTHAQSTNAIITQETIDIMPLDSLVPLISPNDPIGPALGHKIYDHERRSAHSSLSLSRHPTLTNGTRTSLLLSTATLDQLRPVQSPSKSLKPSFKAPGMNSPSPVLPSKESQAWQLYRLRDSCADAIPLRDAPDAIIEGRAGLIKCELLNDRRHAITVDTVGQLALWDIVAGTCKGIFTTDGLRASAASGGSLSDDSDTDTESVSSAAPKRRLVASDLVALVKDRIEGEAAIANWCSVETQTGLLTVHLDEHRCFDAEVYADEAGLEPSVLEGMKEDHRICLGKWVLRNLFDGFINAQVSKFESPPTGRPRASSDPSASGRSVPHRTPGMTISLARPAATAAFPPPPLPDHQSLRPRPMAGRVTEGGAIEAALPALAEAEEHEVERVPQAPMMVESFHRDEMLSSTLSPSSSILGRLKAFSRVNPKRRNDHGVPPTSFGHSSPQLNIRMRSVDLQQQHQQQASVLGRAGGEDFDKQENNRVQAQVLRSVLSKPFTPCPGSEAPQLDLSPDTAILISRESSLSGAWEVMYRGLVKTTDLDIKVLESVAPSWLLEFLLGNRIFSKEGVKVTFVLLPENDDLSELPNGNARLTAAKVLRVRKVAAYVLQKLEIKLNEAAKLDEEIELICNGNLIPFSMSLGAVKQWLWKKGGDVVISYRSKRRNKNNL